MLSGFIDPKIKVTVQDGKTWVTILSTTYADMMYDITLEIQKEIIRYQKKLQ